MAPTESVIDFRSSSPMATAALDSSAAWPAALALSALLCAAAETSSSAAVVCCTAAACWLEFEASSSPVDDSWLAASTALVPTPLKLQATLTQRHQHMPVRQKTKAHRQQPEHRNHPQ